MVYAVLFYVLNSPKICFEINSEMLQQDDDLE